MGRYLDRVAENANQEEDANQNCQPALAVDPQASASQTSPPTTTTSKTGQATGSWLVREEGGIL